RYIGTTTGIGTRALYFDQLEVQRNVGLSGDLYEWSRDTGRVRRLTSNARLHDPDLSPDGTTIVSVRERGDRRELVTVRLKADPTGDNTFETATFRPKAADPTDARRETPVGSGFSRTVSAI